MGDAATWLPPWLPYRAQHPPSVSEVPGQRGGPPGTRTQNLRINSPEDRFAGFAGGLFAAAVVGGVVGPVSAAGPPPGDGDADVDAEQSGESRRYLG